MLCFSGSGGFSATISAKSLSMSDVQAAVNSAGPGDTVKVPSGSSNWSGAVTINKPIYLVGAGQGTTTIFNSTSASSGLETPVFSVSLNQDQRLEISGFWVSASTPHRSNGINLYAGSILPTQIVIHDCTFKECSFGIMNGTGESGACFGVVYNCTFWNCRITCRNSGFRDQAAMKGFATPPFPLGSPNYMVYEDDTINFTDWTGGPQGANYLGDTEYPFNYIVRFCSFSIARNGAITVDGYDQHGNYGRALNDFGMIIHDNTFNYSGSSVGVKLADIRGGVNTLVFNNTIKGQGGNYISLRADPAGSVTPVGNYIWNNKNPDNSTIAVNVSAGSYTASAPAGYVELPYPHPLRASATPTPTPTPAPTPTPTPGPSATPSPTPSPSPTAPTYSNWLNRQSEWIRLNPPTPDSH